MRPKKQKASSAGLSRTKTAFSLEDLTIGGFCLHFTSLRLLLSLFPFLLQSPKLGLA